MADMRERDERFMREALAEARAAAAVGEVPIGAVVVCGDTVIARAHNRRELDADPSAHAEFSALTAASRALGRWRLPDCTVYVTLEPCAMCAGLMVNARIGRCVYGAADPKAGALGSLYRLHGDARLNHRFPVVAGVLGEECVAELREFFRARRDGMAPMTEVDAEHAAARAEAHREETGELDCDGAVASGPAMSPAPRVLIAADSFKGSATSAQVGAWISEGIRGTAPDAVVSWLPIADGGEGTLDALRGVLDGEVRLREVTGPTGAVVQARYLLAGDTAVIETAEAAGFSGTDRSDAAARSATSRGIGELMLAAVGAGARRLYIGLGGTATNDGGAGLLQALGARIVDGSGAAVRDGLNGLAEVTRVDLGPAAHALDGVEVIALTDVRNPLVGRRGALAVFGAQKGLADPAAHDASMVRYARLLDEARAELPAPAAGGRFRSVAGVPGAGAAGGMGAALLAIGATLSSGANTVLDILGFDGMARSADLVITGEGHIDGQTASGKTVAAVAERARRAGAPVVAIVGGRGVELGDVYCVGVDLVIPAVREPMPIERALTPEETRVNLRCAGESAIRAYLLNR